MYFKAIVSNRDISWFCAKLKRKIVTVKYASVLSNSSTRKRSYFC